MTVEDRVQNSASVACPSGTPTTAQCFILVETANSPQRGAVSVDPVLDIEYPPDQPQCGATSVFTEHLHLHGGDVVVQVSGPYLCLGAVGTTQRRFTLVSGTGQFAGVTGSGSIQFSTLSFGAVESWQGTLT